MSTPVYDAFVKATREGAPAPAVLEHIFERIGRSFPESLQSQEGGSVDVSAGIQAWLDDNAGKVCVLPAGRWGIDEPLRPGAGTTLRAEPGAVLHSLDPDLEAHVKVFGSYLSSTKREIAAPVGIGDRTITTKTAHGYAVGDVVRIVSQRVSTNPTDAGDWQLGWKTVGGQGPYFAEFGRVYDVPDSTTVVLDSGLIFPGYRPDNSQETDPDAGPSAYLQKTNGEGDDVTLDGLSLTGPSRYGVRVIRAVRPKVYKITQDKPDTGRHIGFEDCYLGEAEDVYVLNRYLPKGSENHAVQNSAHIVGCQETGFRNATVIRGSQAFDITYSGTSPYVSLGCYLDDCKSPSNLFNPVTLHPGTYKARISRCIFLSCQEAGIAIRTNCSIISDTQVVGSRGVNSSGVPFPGIYCSEGGGKYSTISNCTVEGFINSVRINDGGGKPFSGRFEIAFRGCTFRDFDLAFKRLPGYGTPLPTRSQIITLHGCTFESSRPGAVGVETCDSGRGVNGLSVVDSDVWLSSTASVFLKVDANSVDIIYRDNRLHEVGAEIEWAPSVTPQVRSVVHAGGNTVLRRSSIHTPPCTPDFAVKSTDNQMLYLNDGSWHLDDFLEEGRWRTGSNAMVSTSKGYPLDNTTGWLEVVAFFSSTTPFVTQRFHQELSTGSTTYYRRLLGGAWSAWSVV